MFWKNQNCCLLSLTFKDILQQGDNFLIRVGWGGLKRAFIICTNRTDRQYKPLAQVRRGNVLIPLNSSRSEVNKFVGPSRRPERS